MWPPVGSTRHWSLLRCSRWLGCPVLTCRTEAIADRRIGDDPVPSWAAIFADLAAIVVGIGADLEAQSILDRDAEVLQPSSASSELMGDQIPRVLSYSPSNDSQDLSLLIIR